MKDNTIVGILLAILVSMCYFGGFFQAKVITPAPLVAPDPAPAKTQLWVCHTDNCAWCERQEKTLAGMDLPGYDLRHQHNNDGPVKNVREFPTLALFNASGVELARHVGYLDAPALKRWLDTHTTKGTL